MERTHSLHGLMLLLILASCGSGFLAFVPAYAQESSSSPSESDSDSEGLSPSELSSLSITDLLSVEVAPISRTPEPMRRVPMSVFTLGREGLLDWATVEPNDVLKRLPGASFYDTNYRGQNSVMTRGESAIYRTIFLIEQMPIYDQGWLHISPYFFKQVDYVRGPVGLTWGGAATAGLVNYTIRDDLDGAEGGVGVGSRGFLEWTAMFGAKSNENPENHLFIGFHTVEQDRATVLQTVPPTGQPTLYYPYGIGPSWQALASAKQNALKLTFLYSHDVGDDPEIAPDWPKSSSPTTIWWGNHTDGSVFNNQHLNTLAFRGEYHLLQSQESDLYLYGQYWEKTYVLWTLPFEDTQRNQAGGAVGNFHLLENQMTLTVGGEYGRFRANDPTFNLRDAANPAINSPSNGFGQSGPLLFDDANTFAQVSYDVLPSLTLLGGGRVDYRSTSSSKYIFTPRAGIMLDLTPELTLKYVFNQSSRRPVGNEAGFPNLGTSVQPEDITAHELIAIYQHQAFSAETTFFYQTLNNQILQVLTPGSIQAYTNLGGNYDIGLEYNLKYRVSPITTVYLNGIAQRFRQYASSAAQFDDDTGSPSNVYLYDNRQAGVPALSTTLGAEVEGFRFLRAGADVRLSGWIPYFAPDGVTSSERNVWFFDANLRTRPFWKRYQASLVGENLFNTQIAPARLNETTSPGITTARPRQLIFRLSASI